jgi:hypothetical protein
MGERTTILLWGERNNIALLGGFFYSPSRPSDKSRVEVKTLEWLEVGLVTGDLEFSFSELMSTYIIRKINAGGFDTNET